MLVKTYFTSQTLQKMVYIFFCIYGKITSSIVFKKNLIDSDNLIIFFQYMSGFSVLINPTLINLPICRLYGIALKLREKLSKYFVRICFVRTTLKYPLKPRLKSKKKCITQFLSCWKFHCLLHNFSMTFR